MKSTLFVLVSLMVSAANANDIRICGAGGYAMFNSKNVFQCVITLDTCETQERAEAGWLPSATGRCHNLINENMCGMGGLKMQYPNNPKMTVNTLNTCQTNALEEMGWVPAN